MLQYVKSVGLVQLSSVGIGSVGKAASFDCNKATTETEIAICGDPELSALDDILGFLWKQLVNKNQANISFYTASTAPMLVPTDPTQVT